MDDAPSPAPAAAWCGEVPAPGTRPLSTLRLWGRLLTRRSIPCAHGLEHYGIEAAEGAREAGPTAAQGPPPRAAPARERGATPAGGAGRGSGPRRHRRRPTAGGVAVAASVGRSPGAAVARQTARPQSRAVISAAIRDSGASGREARLPHQARHAVDDTARFGLRQDLAAGGTDASRQGVRAHRPRGRGEDHHGNLLQRLGLLHLAHARNRSNQRSASSRARCHAALDIQCDSPGSSM
jgi:hypothetical protein